MRMSRFATTLLAAQKDPVKYHDLVIPIAAKIP